MYGGETERNLYRLRLVPLPDKKERAVTGA